MEILLQLGANYSAFIQFFIFAISIALLTIFVYGPFFKAYDQRLTNTKGTDEIAKTAVEESKKLGQIYQLKAREINDKIKTIFETERAAGSRAADEILKKAKSDSEVILKKARGEIEMEKNKAQGQVAGLSQEIAEQLTRQFEQGL